MKLKDIPDSVWYMVGAGAVLLIATAKGQEIIDTLKKKVASLWLSGNIGMGQPGVNVEPPSLSNIAAINAGLHAPANDKTALPFDPGVGNGW